MKYTVIKHMKICFLICTVFIAKYAIYIYMNMVLQGKKTKKS